MDSAVSNKPAAALAALQDGGCYPSAPPGYSEHLGRASYHAWRVGTTLFIVAEGSVPNLQTIADLRQLPVDIFPPRFGLYFYTPQGLVAPVVRPFKFSEAFGFPVDVARVTIVDEAGRHSVEIKDVADLPSPDVLPAPSNTQCERPMTATGQGDSLQAAFDDAVSKLPSGNPQVADDIVTYTARELGRFVGGIAGFDRYFARVDARFGGGTP